MVFGTQTDFSLTNPHIKKGQSWRALRSEHSRVECASTLSWPETLSTDRLRTPKRTTREKSKKKGMSLMGKKLSFFWKGNKERGDSGVGVRGAEAAPTTDLEPAQDSSLELGFPSSVLTMCA